MKKNFPLHLPGKADERVLDSIKHDVRKYIKRERGKTLPEGFTVWEFDCKIGPTPDSAETQPLANLGPAIDAIAQAGATAVYIEILARPATRTPPAAPAAPM